MKSDWTVANLGQVCEIYQPKTISKKQLIENGEYPVFGANGIIGRYDKYNHEHPQLLITCRGATCGSVNVSLPKSWITGNAMIIRPLIEDIDIRYLEYYCRGGIDFSKVITGAAQPQITRQSLSPVEIAYPLLSEQKRIVAILDEAFAGIDTAIDNTEKNVANARELFESYLNSVFTKRGEGWRDKSVGEMAEVCLGKMLDKQKNKGVLRPYLRNLNVQWFNVDTNDVQLMKFEDKEKERYGVLKGDLLICEGGYPGRAAIWEEESPIFFQKALHRVRFKEPSLNRWLLYFLYLSDANGSLSKHFTGAGIQHFTGKALKQFHLPIAPLSDVRSFLEKISDLHGETQELEALYQQKISSLNELKKSLLQKAFSGELTAEHDKHIDVAVA